ncbi:hypothetical protein ACT3TB_12715 [Micrococcaceae sp. AOP34-BR2-30]
MNASLQPRLYARGYLVSTEATQLTEEISHFKYERIAGFYVYRDELVEAQFAQVNDDAVLVLGKAWPLSSGPIGTSRSHVADRLLATAVSSGREAFEDSLYDLGGRYVIIIRLSSQVFVYHDATGSRSVFFDASGMRIASHFDMLHRLNSDGAFGQPFGGNFRAEFMWDRTLNSNVFALMPNHRLDLISGAQDRYFMFVPNRAHELTADERIDQIAVLWREQMKHLVEASEDRPIAASISGGLDARTLLALARDVQPRMRSFTYTSGNAIGGETPTSEWAKKMTMDYDIVRKMEEFLPADHRYIQRAKFHGIEDASLSIIKRNSELDHGRWLLPMYAEIFDDPRVIHYRGNLLEIGRQEFRGRLDQSLDERWESVWDYYAKRGNVDVDVVRRAGQEKMQQFSYSEVHGDYDSTDVFYWENRHGRWYAQILNETDTIFDTFSAVNSRRLLDLFLAFPAEQRRAGTAQRMLIDACWPVLNFFGVNERRTLFDKFVKPDLLR